MDLLEQKRVEIIKKMKERNLTQHFLAKRTSMNIGNLNRFLNGKGGLSLEKLLPLLDYLGIRV